MLFTLYEALQQIDPHVVLDDGIAARSVGQILFSIDPANPTEYVIVTDSAGRLLISKIDKNGFAIFPAAFTEKKSDGYSATAATPLIPSSTSALHSNEKNPTC